MFILCGIADLPTWPGVKPSVTSSWPAINRMVCASDDGPAATCTGGETTSWSSERGYTCPTLVKMSVKPQEFGDPPLELGKAIEVTVEQVEHILCRAHRTLDAAQRVAVDQRTQPLQRDKHLLRGRGEPLNVVACAATLWLRPAITRSR